MDNYLIENDIVTDLTTDKEYRVLFIEHKKGICFLIELHTKKTTIKTLDTKWLTSQIDSNYRLEPPVYVTENINELTNKQRTLMNQRFKVIESVFSTAPEPFYYDKRYKKRAIDDAVDQYDIDRASVYKYIRLYLQGGKTKIALLPNYNKCGGKGNPRINVKKPGVKSRLSRTNCNPENSDELNGVGIDDYHYDNMIQTMKRTLLGKKSCTISQAYKRMIYEFYSPYNEISDTKEVLPSYKIPTYNQFYYLVKKEEKIAPIKFLEAKEGQRNFMLKYRAVLGSSSLEAYQPGFRYEIDATKPYIPLIDSKRKYSIGTATVYYVIDVFSVMIVGFYVGLDNASKKTACSALLSCIEDKSEIARNAGIDVADEDFCVNILPKNLTADRGELVGELGDRIASQLGVNLETTASYRGDMKGIVEKAFDVTEKDLLGVIPNFNLKNWKDKTRGNIGNEKYPVLTINDLRTIFLKHIKKHNKSHMKSYPMTKAMIADKLNPTPNNVWKWGVKNLGCDGIRTDLEYARYVLSEEKTAAITQSGIEYQGLCYTSKVYDQRVDEAFVRARSKGREKIKIHMDERNIGTVLVKLDDTKEIIEFVLTSKSQRQFGNITLFEYVNYIERKKDTQTQYTDINNQVMVDCMGEMEDTIQLAKQASKGSKPISKDKRKNREIENQIDRLTQSVIVSENNERGNYKDNLLDLKLLRKKAAQNKLNNYRSKNEKK